MIRRKRVPAGLGGGGGLNGDGMLRSILTIPHAKILTLPTYSTGAFDILPAPGAGKAIVFHQGIVISNISVSYTNLDALLSLQFIIDPGNFDNVVSRFCGPATPPGGDGHSDRILTTQSWKIISTFVPYFNVDISVDFVGQSISYGAGTVSGASLLENGKLSFIANNGGSGNFTGGDAANSLKIITYYDIIDF